MIRQIGVMVLAAALSGTGLTAPAQAGTWADNLFSEHGVDFGPVPRGSKVRHAFVLTNNLNEPINVLDVRSSCGCTTGFASATTVPPGQQASIEAQMDTRNFVGVKATVMTVMLMTASGKQAEARFTVQSNILADVVVDPGSVDFGTLSRGQAAEKIVRIERLGKPDWQFTRLLASESLCQVVTANLTQAYRNADGVGYVLSIKLKPDAPAGMLREEIRLVSNDQETSSVPVLVTAQVQGGLTASPSLLALGSAAAGKPVQGRFLVRGSSPFTITQIEGNGDGFRLTEADASSPRALHVLNLEYDPAQSAVSGDLKRSFRIVTSLKDEAPLDLAATVKVVR